VLLFAILAIITGCNSYRGIVTFIDVHRSKLNAAFGLAWRRVPAHTAIRYILQGLEPTNVEAAFRQHATRLQAACAQPGPCSIALDGKTLRGSFDSFKDRLAAQVLSAFATDTSLVLAHIDIAEKSNEIPAAQTLLAELGVPSGTLVTLDAIHCQKKHFEVAKQADIALIVQVKSNQPTLLQTITEVADTAKPLSAWQSEDKGRNRHESRTVTVFDPAKTLANTDWHDHVDTIIRVERVVYTRNAKTGLWASSSEVAFYVSNEPLHAVQAAEGARAHWRVETTSHYSRDVTLGEDRSRIRCNPGVFARLRSFGVNILKANRTSTLSQDRYRAALGGFEALARLVHL
jgi:predicted transposase YbfD/YdcC